MDFSVDTDNKKLTLSFEVVTKQPERIRCIVFDPTKPNTVYANGAVTINGTDTFYVRMPQSPVKAMVRIFNDRNGNTKNIDQTFKYTCKKLPLKSKLTAFNYLNPDIYNFVAFAQEFAENAKILSCGVRLSDNGKFCIRYVEHIKGDKGQILSTPASLNIQSKRITVSKVNIVNYTVPEIMAVLLHEFSHGFLIADVEDELAADYNALRIFCGLGYSRKEAFKVFCYIFGVTEDRTGKIHQGNRKRMEKIIAFLNRFENENTPNYGYYYPNEKTEFIMNGQKVS